MDQQELQRRVLVIDRQPYWRRLSTHTLIHAGFTVHTTDQYIFPPIDASEEWSYPDLVILGCASIGPAEKRLILQLLDDKRHLLVLSSALEEDEMRSLFLHGANDVTTKPYNPDRLLDIVRQVLASIDQRDSYEIFAEEGVL